MKYLIIITLIILSNNLFAQKDTIIWQDINGKTLRNSDGIEGYYKDNKTLAKHINKHIEKFQKKWSAHHAVLGKSMLNKIFDNLEVFYVRKYRIERIREDEILYRQSKYAVNDLFFFYDKYYLGRYGFNLTNDTTTQARNNYWCKANYSIILWHYTNYPVDMEIVHDIFTKGNEFFTIEGFCEDGKPEMSFWFIPDDYSRPVKIPRSEVHKHFLIDYDDKSIFKSQYTNTK